MNADAQSSGVRRHCRGSPSRMVQGVDSSDAVVIINADATKIAALPNELNAIVIVFNFAYNYDQNYVILKFEVRDCVWK